MMHSLQQRLGHLEADEIVILLGRVAILRDLHYVESEFCLQMCGVVLRIPDEIAVFRPQFGVLDGNGLVDGRMADDVRSVVRKRAQGKRVFVCILTLQQQFPDEVSAANVVHEIAEFGVAERVVAQILYDGASVGIRMSFGDLRFCQRRESAQQQRPDIIRPNQIDDLLVRQNGVCGYSTSKDKHEQEQCCYSKRNTPWTR